LPPSGGRVTLSFWRFFRALMKRLTDNRRQILTAITLLCWLLGYTSVSRADVLALDYFSFKIFRLDQATGATLGVFADLTDKVHQSPFDMVIGPDQNLYVADYGGRRILRYSGQSGAFIDVFTNTYGQPDSLAFDATGNLFVSNFGAFEKFAANTGTPLGEIFPDVYGHYYKQTRIGPDGLLYAIHIHDDTNDIVRFNPDTGALVDTFLPGRPYMLPTDFTFGPSGEMFITSWHATALYRYAGTTPTSVDDLQSWLNFPPAVYLDVLTYFPDGSLLAVDTGNTFDDWRMKKYSAATGAFIADFPKGVFVAMAFTPPVPEPSALVSLLLALPTVVCRRQRNR
jgi:hypothetical protein